MSEPITAGISAAKAAFEVSKVALDLFDIRRLKLLQLRSVYLNCRVLSLAHNWLLETRAEENRSLRHQLEEATRKADFGSDLRFEHGVYWRDNHPYCPVCWDVRREPVRLSGPVWREGVTVSAGKSPYNCPIDKSDFALPRNVPG